MNATEQEITAYLLKDKPITPSQAIRIVLEGLEALETLTPPENLLLTLRRCMQSGIRCLLQEKQSKPFAEAVRHALHLRRDCSVRTVRDFRQCMNKLMQMDERLASRPLNSITPEECSQMLEKVFPSSSRRKKARSCLSALFREGMRCGWNEENPIQKVETPRIVEKTIVPLTPEEIKRLLDTARQPTHRPCLPPVGLMLYAGIRPYEVSRLTWAEIDWDEGEVSVPPRHSKTGGGRHIPLCPALRKLLRNHPQHHRTDTPVCPPNWLNRWKALRAAAGFRTWQQDILRHTFASYYAKAFHDLTSLQLYMGHHDVQLLRTRYVNMKGLRKQDALNFWGGRSFVNRQRGRTGDF